MSAAELAPYLIAEWDAALKLRFLMLAGTTCLIYDHCVTFAQEASARLFMVKFSHANAQNHR